MPEIKIKTPDEILKIKNACKIVALVLEKIEREMKAGVTTEYLDSVAEKVIRGNQAEPVFIGYRGYRHATCISINEEIVHGLPGKRVIKDGDIVSFDVGVKKDGYCGDAARTFIIGKGSAQANKLVRISLAALAAGIKQARAGNHLGDISSAIQKKAEQNGYSVVRELYGHGIGKELHEEPLIPNYGEPGEGPKLVEGMVLAIEPMLNLGTWKIKTLDDNWTVITADKSLSCHFEQTVLVTKNDPEILTA